MATHKGSEGTVKIGSNAIAEVRTWSINQTADTIEDTTMGDSARTYQSSLNTWDGSVDVFWDETDTTGQGACTIGTSITLNVYPEGAATGDTYFSGTALVTGISRTASFDGMIESSITFKGTGALSISTAS
jgi:predicted secreted protein